jgi:hypothetical protein
VIKMWKALAALGVAEELLARRAVQREAQRIVRQHGRDIESAEARLVQETEDWLQWEEELSS